MTDFPISFVASRSTQRLASAKFGNSNFPSTHINLSPFTKDFRGGEQLNESID